MCSACTEIYLQEEATVLLVKYVNLEPWQIPVLSLCVQWVTRYLPCTSSFVRSMEVIRRSRGLWLAPSKVLLDTLFWWYGDYIFRSTLLLTYTAYSEVCSLHLTHPRGAAGSHSTVLGDQLQILSQYLSQVMSGDTTICMFWWWGNLSTWRKPTQTWGEHANSTLNGPAPAWNQT